MGYSQPLLMWQDAVQRLGSKLSAVPGVIRHHWHGSLKNRQYTSRLNVIKDFDVAKGLSKRADGLLVMNDEQVARRVQRFYRQVCPLS